MHTVHDKVGLIASDDGEDEVGTEFQEHIRTLPHIGTSLLDIAATLTVRPNLVNADDPDARPNRSWGTLPRLGME
jgi:hypothetical protein